MFLILSLYYRNEARVCQWDINGVRLAKLEFYRITINEVRIRKLEFYGTLK